MPDRFADITGYQGSLYVRRYKRYEELGEQVLSSFSGKPINSPLQKRNETNERIILDLGKSRNLGARRLQNELKRLYSISFSTATIHKVLKKKQCRAFKIKASL